MTSINIIAKGDVLWMFGDGASYDMDGVLVSITGKTYVLSSMSTAILFSGRTIGAPYVVHHLSQIASDFDDLQEKIADRLPAIVDHVTELFGEDEKAPEAGQGFRLFCGGWSKARQRTALFQIATTSTDYRAEDDVPPYTVLETKGLMMPGLTDEERMMGFGGPPVVNADTIANVAMTTLELQRHQLRADGYSCVGGLVELVEVRRDRIETRILHRWSEDKVGQLMQPRPVDWQQWRRDHPVNDPVLGATSADTMGQLNRQQRRQLARTQRRAS